MYKFIVLAALVAVALADPGFLASPVLPVATSYANTYRAPVVKSYASAPLYAAPAALSYTSGAALYNAPYPYLSSGYIY